MKSFGIHAKPIRLISSALLLAFSSMAMPAMAYDTSQSTQAPTTKAQPASPATTSIAKPSCPCKCQRPYRRFTKAMEELKKEGLVSNEDIKKIYDALMKIPLETLDAAPDKDLAAADALYKDKVLTEEQYNKISTFLKQNTPQKP